VSLESLPDGASEPEALPFVLVLLVAGFGSVAGSGLVAFSEPLTPPEEEVIALLLVAVPPAGLAALFGTVLELVLPAVEPLGPES